MDLKMGKTQLFNSGGVVKWAYFQKKWSIPLMFSLPDSHTVYEPHCIIRELVFI